MAVFCASSGIIIVLRLYFNRQRAIAAFLKYFDRRSPDQHYRSVFQRIRTLVFVSYFIRHSRRPIGQSVVFSKHIGQRSGGSACVIPLAPEAHGVSFVARSRSSEVNIVDVGLHVVDCRVVEEMDLLFFEL